MILESISDPLAVDLTLAQTSSGTGLTVAYVDSFMLSKADLTNRNAQRQWKDIKARYMEAGDEDDE